MSERTAILGLGITGFSCLRYLAGREPLLVLDTRDTPPNADAALELCPEAEFRFGATAAGTAFDGVRRLIVSPGVALEHCLVQRAVAGGVPLVSDIDLFCEAARAPIYAITGTNGKSTVTALAGHLLERLGGLPGVGGNLGAPALDLLADDRDSYVLELSSFQLERMGVQRFAAATVLNISEDHLDRHGSMERYLQSKQRIYRGAARAVANRGDPATLPAAPGPAVTTFGLDAPAPGDWGVRTLGGQPTLVRGEEPVMPLETLPLAGTHNALNVLAACALVTPGDRQVAPLSDALAGFAGLPHRCQPVAEIDGITFVDDSKATNVGAALAALQGLGGATPGLVLIAGGDGKGADFAPLAAAVRQHVKAVVLLGRDAPKLAAALSGAAPVETVASMRAAVAAARRAAAPGDTVLLSLACASLDMYANFAARGADFAAAVEALR